uniref:Aspartic proteinase Asp1 n=1 Tax=Aegilops tauschii TaxID=37682 RepID=N1QSK7_AEGTA
MAAMWSLIISLLLLLLPIAPSSSIKFPLEGNVYPVSHFYATLNIGEPAKPYFLDVDTGSNLTWLECDHPVHGCKGCHLRPPHPYYKPAADKDIPGIPECSRKDPHRCHYEIKYVTGKSEGDLATDIISVIGKDKKNIAFGCGYNQEEPADAPPSSVDGILGLASFIEVTHQIKSLFSSKGKGVLYVGDFNPPSRGVTWVPMRESLFYYSPGLAELFIDKQPIRGNPTFEAVFDSGTTYTFVPAQIYNELVSKVRGTLSESSLVEVKGRALPLCWKGKRPFRSVNDVKNQFKALSLKITHASSTSNLDIPPQNYLIVEEDGKTCLAIRDASSDPVMKELNFILIGAVTMQDLFVIYNNESKQLGWVRAQCDKAQELESVIDSRL